jgi:hypothetical protein
MLSLEKLYLNDAVLPMNMRRKSVKKQNPREQMSAPQPTENTREVILQI